MTEKHGYIGEAEPKAERSLDRMQLMQELRELQEVCRIHPEACELAHHRINYLLEQLDAD